VLALRKLVDELGLPLLAGAAGAARPVRWVHISELPDPTPFLSAASCC
jgi:purine catabolism regulator